jgi:hypothetical protein
VPLTKRLTFRLTPAEFERLEALAKARDVTWDAACATSWPRPTSISPRGLATRSPRKQLLDLLRERAQDGNVAAISRLLEIERTRDPRSAAIAEPRLRHGGLAGRLDRFDLAMVASSKLDRFCRCCSPTALGLRHSGVILARRLPRSTSRSPYRPRRPGRARPIRYGRSQRSQRTLGLSTTSRTTGSSITRSRRRTARRWRPRKPMRARRIWFGASTS